LIKSPLDIPLGFRFSGRNREILGRNLVASYNYQSGNIEFLYVPPALSGKPIEQWTVPFPFERLRCTAYPPKNILVAIEKDEE
jgi:hypothetical protein